MRLLGDTRQLLRRLLLRDRWAAVGEREVVFELQERIPRAETEEALRVWKARRPQSEGVIVEPLATFGGNGWSDGKPWNRSKATELYCIERRLLVFVELNWND